MIVSCSAAVNDSKSICQWRNRYRVGGSNSLHGRGRLTKAERAAREETLTAEKQAAKKIRQASLEELARAQRRIAALERKIGQQQVELDFFSKPWASQGKAPAERRAWRDGIYEVIQAMTTSRLQGEIGIEHMCQLAGISRSGYYRHWLRSAPHREETGLRDAIQRLALKHRRWQEVDLDRRTATLGGYQNGSKRPSLASSCVRSPAPSGRDGGIGIRGHARGRSYAGLSKVLGEDRGAWWVAGGRHAAHPAT
jgi:hypothetical protein